MAKWTQSSVTRTCPRALLAPVPLVPAQTTSTAYDEMQVQNTRLLGQLTEKDEANNMLLAERVKVCVWARLSGRGECWGSLCAAGGAGSSMLLAERVQVCARGVIWEEAGGMLDGLACTGPHAV